MELTLFRRHDSREVGKVKIEHHHSKKKKTILQKMVYLYRSTFSVRSFDVSCMHCMVRTLSLYLRHIDRHLKHHSMFHTWVMSLRMRCVVCQHGTLQVSSLTRHRSSSCVFVSVHRHRRHHRCLRACLSLNVVLRRSSPSVVVVHSHSFILVCVSSSCLLVNICSRSLRKRSSSCMFVSVRRLRCRHRLRVCSKGRVSLSCWPVRQLLLYAFIVFVCPATRWIVTGMRKKKIII